MAGTLLPVISFAWKKNNCYNNYSLKNILCRLKPLTYT